LKNLGEVEKAVREADAVFHYAANPEVQVNTTNPEIHFNENVIATTIGDVFTLTLAEVVKKMALM
jgi:nucleoside-diphosphate-sugar epimerase